MKPSITSSSLKLSLKVLLLHLLFLFSCLTIVEGLIFCHFLFIITQFCCPGVTKTVQLEFTAVFVNTFIRFAVVTLLFVCTFIVLRVAD